MKGLNCDSIGALQSIILCFIPPALMRFSEKKSERLSLNNKQ